jgi:hypothetical protein
MAGKALKSSTDISIQLEDTPSAVAKQIRRTLRQGGSPEHAAGVQWFFKEEIKSHGWYTGDLRRMVRKLRKEILRQREFDFLVRVADSLFTGNVLEEKAPLCSCWRTSTRSSPIANFECSTHGSAESAVGPTMTRWSTI